MVHGPGLVDRLPGDLHEIAGAGIGAGVVDQNVTAPEPLDRLPDRPGRVAVIVSPGHGRKYSPGIPPPRCQVADRFLQVPRSPGRDGHPDRPKIQQLRGDRQPDTPAPARDNRCFSLDARTQADRPPTVDAIKGYFLDPRAMISTL